MLSSMKYTANQIIGIPKSIPKCTFQGTCFQKKKKNLLNLNTLNFKCVNVIIKYKIFRHIKSLKIPNCKLKSKFSYMRFPKDLDVTQP